MYYGHEQRAEVQRYREYYGQEPPAPDPNFYKVECVNAPTKVLVALTRKRSQAHVSYQAGEER